MYLRHFGLKQAPFTLTANPDFFFALPRHREALNTLLFAAHSGEGFILITGEIGTGKTMLCSKLIQDASAGFCIAHLPIPARSARGLLLDLARELGLPLSAGIDEATLVALIREVLLEKALQGQRTLVCLDEAQALTPATLEALRLLTNLETRHEKLLQVAVFGQPELETMLASDELRQLKQRITSHYRLEPINSADIGDYLEHRLRVAGYNGPRLFSPKALKVMSEATGGVPRLLSIVAHKALLLVFGQGGHLVEGRHAEEAARDTPAAKPPRPRKSFLGISLGARR
jgi:MSHA biogenesis protein MshM